MRIRTGLTGTLHSHFYCTHLYETIAVQFWTLGAGTVTAMYVIRVSERIAVAESCSIHWPGEYTPTPPSPHSLNTFQVSRYRNRTICSWVGESGGKIMLSMQTINKLSTSPAIWFCKTRFTWGHVQELKNAHNSIIFQNRVHVYMNFFDHKDLGNHLLQ